MGCIETGFREKARGVITFRAALSILLKAV